MEDSPASSEKTRIIGYWYGIEWCVGPVDAERVLRMWSMCLRNAGVDELAESFPDAYVTLPCIVIGIGSEERTVNEGFSLSGGVLGRRVLQQLPVDLTNPFVAVSLAGTGKTLLKIRKN